MKKKNLVTGALALTLLFNTTGCTITEKSDFISNTNITKSLENAYKANSIFVTTKTLITGEKEIVFTYENGVDIFSSFPYKSDDIDKKVPLIEYLSVEQLQENFTYKELIVLLKNIRSDYHGVSYNPNLQFPYEVFTETKTEDEIYYLTSNIKFGIVKNAKDNACEIYLYYPSKTGSLSNGVYTYNEFFTGKSVGQSTISNTFSLNDFIPTELLRNAYTEKELRALLAFVREVYHNELKLYEETPKLTLQEN